MCILNSDKGKPHRHGLMVKEADTPYPHVLICYTKRACMLAFSQFLLLICWRRRFENVPDPRQIFLKQL